MGVGGVGVCMKPITPAELSPLPWRADESVVFSGSTDLTVALSPALTKEDDYQNAAYIAHAANCFPELVKALEETMECLFHFHRTDGRGNWAECHNIALGMARAALAKAKGENL